MKVLSSWLHELLDAPGPIAPEAIADAFDDLGTPVEEETRIGEGLDGVEVVEVLALRPHPNADKIQLVDVDRGDGEALSEHSASPQGRLRAVPYLQSDRPTNHGQLVRRR